MKHDGFLRDILAAPERLAACLDAYDGRVIGRFDTLTRRPIMGRDDQLALKNLRRLNFPQARYLRGALNVTVCDDLFDGVADS